MTTRGFAVAIAALALVACSSSSKMASQPSPSPSPAAATLRHLGSLGSAGCKPAVAVHGGEAGFDSGQGSFWALFFAAVPPPAGQEIKVVWRMTGSGPFTFRVSDTSGVAAPLVWGPNGHDSSNWNHPGDEVGAGLKFQSAGCWDIHVTRSDAEADLWLEVTS